MANNLLTFICTVKNGERFIEQSLGSILSICPGSPLVVVDDGSGDKSLTILQELAKKHPEVTVVETAGVGRGTALNLALSKVNTQFVSNMDADDLLAPEFPRLIQAIKSAPLNVAIIFGNAKIFVRDVDIIPTDEQSTDQSEKGAITPLGPMYRGNSGPHIGFIMRTSAALKVGGYDTNRNSQLDYDLWIRLEKAGYKFLNYNAITAYKRLHKEQAFEYHNHMLYALEAQKLRFSACDTIFEKLEILPSAFIRILWAALPRSVRIAIQQMRSR